MRTDLLDCYQCLFCTLFLLRIEKTSRAHGLSVGEKGDEEIFNQAMDRELTTTPTNLVDHHRINRVK